MPGRYSARDADPVGLTGVIDMEADNHPALQATRIGARRIFRQFEFLRGQGRALAVFRPDQGFHIRRDRKIRRREKRL